MADKSSRIQRRLRKVRSAGKNLLDRAVSPIWSLAAPFFVKMAMGPMPRQKKVAVFLIYAPKGVPLSLFLTVTQVQQLGYAVLFVVNGGLAAADEARLLAQSWRLMRRPNLGYDFGGYRDGLTHVLTTGEMPDRLLFMNDTIWCPATNGTPCLTQLDAMQTPYAALCSFTYRPKGTRPVDLVRRNYGCSFAFCVDKTVIASSAFQTYWRKMGLYGAKEAVVQFGEVGFSHAMMAAGFMPKFVLDQAHVLQDIAGMPDAEVNRLFHLLPMLSRAGREKHREVAAQLQMGAITPPMLRQVMLDLAAVMNPWDTFACYGLLTGQIDFIKKANFKSADNARRLLDMLDGCGVVLAPAVRHELLAVASRMIAR